MYFGYPVIESSDIRPNKHLPVGLYNFFFITWERKRAVVYSGHPVVNNEKNTNFLKVVDAFFTKINFLQIRKRAGYPVSGHTSYLAV